MLYSGVVLRMSAQQSIDREDTRMTRRKPLSKRITILSRSNNLTQKQEHQLVAMADRARHLEADLVELREKVERVRDLADTYARGRGGPTARRILAALDGEEAS